jgi:hypothetical protein
MRLAWKIYLALLACLCFVAYGPKIWGWDGLFFYHTEEELGHMLAHLGKRYDVRIFSKHFSWIDRRA